MKFSGYMGNGLRNNSLDFGGGGGSKKFLNDSSPLIGPIIFTFNFTECSALAEVYFLAFIYISLTQLVKMFLTYT